MAAGPDDVHGTVHVLERVLGLLDEFEEDGGAKLGVARLVHLEDLVKCVHVDGIAEVELDIILDAGVRSARVTAGGGAARDGAGQVKPTLSSDGDMVAVVSVDGEYHDERGEWEAWYGDIETYAEGVRGEEGPNGEEREATRREKNLDSKQSSSRAVSRAEVRARVRGAWPVGARLRLSRRRSEGFALVLAQTAVGGCGRAVVAAVGRWSRRPEWLQR